MSLISSHTKWVFGIVLPCALLAGIATTYAPSDLVPIAVFFLGWVAGRLSP